MKSISKKLLSAVLSVSMIMGTNTINFPLKVTASAEMAVTVSLAGLTLGQGMYLEPETYTLSEINRILQALFGLPAHKIEVIEGDLKE